MKINMGNGDRLMRIALAVLFAVLYFTKTVTGSLGIILLVLGAIFLLTSFAGFCPLYTLLGVKTRRNRKL